MKGERCCHLIAALELDLEFCTDFSSIKNVPSIYPSIQQRGLGAAVQAEIPRLLCPNISSGDPQGAPRPADIHSSEPPGSSPKRRPEEMPEQLQHHEEELYFKLLLCWYTGSSTFGHEGRNTD